MPRKDVEFVVEARVIVPGLAVREFGPVRLAGEITNEAASEADTPTHTAGFESIRVGGKLYWLKGDQRLVVAHLWEAWVAGEPFVSAACVMDAIDRTGKLRDVFAGSDAWGGVVVDARSKGGPTGSFCVAWANFA